MLRLLLCDYQRTVRYYTIYRTFKRRSSDDFTTILRLFFGRNYDYWLRLFQPECYDYCSPLLAIGRKPEKRCGGSRQWFRAARRATVDVLPRRKGGCQTVDPLTRCQSASRRAWEASRPRRADLVQVETLTPQQVRRVCTADSVPALASNPHTVGTDPAAAGMVCPLIYLIIIGGCADLCSVPAWHRWYYIRLCQAVIVGG